MLTYCKKCLIPATRPEQTFDSEGVCDACRSVNTKAEINWEKRELEFRALLEKYRGDGSYWDCIIPVSGGKDSVYQALTMRDKYDMTPLCVNHIPCDQTEVGKKNLTFLRDQGFDLIQMGADRATYKKLVKIGFEKLGDSCWPEHIGIFTIPAKASVAFKVPLIIWGENSQFEYGGPASKKENRYLDRNWLEQFQMLGHRLEDAAHDGVPFKKTRMLHYPSDKEILDVGVTGLFLGYYEPWDSKRNADTVIARGWNRNPDGPVEGAYNDIENLDCKWIGGLHDYMKYIKFGFGRASDQLSIEIRAGRMTREQALLALQQTDEGKIPWKYIPDFLSYIDISEQDFINTLDKFTNPMLFETDDAGNIVRDSNRDVIPLFKPE